MKFIKQKRHISLSKALVFTPTLLAAAISHGGIEQLENRQLPRNFNDAKLDQPIISYGESINHHGEYLIELKSPAVTRGGTAKAIDLEQEGLMHRHLKKMHNARVLGKTRSVLNAVIIEADSRDLAELQKDLMVERILPVNNYTTDLLETVPHIGAKELQDLGVDGTGVTVAVIDSGVDYTHAALGGEGTLEAYTAAWGEQLEDARNITLDGMFPTEKVIGGYDFVGELWTGGTDSPP